MFSKDEANDNEEPSTTESIQNDTAQTTKEEQEQDAELTQIDENKPETTVSNDKETTTVSPMSQLPDLPETPNVLHFVSSFNTLNCFFEFF